MPTVRLRAAWLDAHAEWGPGVHEDGFGLEPGDAVASATGFTAWPARLSGERCTYRWIVDDGRVLGGIALRHGPGEDVARSCYLGYGIRTTARGTVARYRIDVTRS